MDYQLPAFAELVGIEILEAATDRVVGRMVVGPQHSNGHDRVHGGAIMTLADTLGAIGTVLNLRSNTATTTIESKTNFLVPARGWSERPWYDAHAAAAAVPNARAAGHAATPDDSV